MTIRKRYLPFVAFSILALLTAMWAGLSRMGWQLSASPKLVMAHGPLMVCGFLGTLIPLERAVAIRKKWMFAAPILTALGWIALLISSNLIGASLFTLGSLVTLAILLYLFRREPKIHIGIMLTGSFAWVVGNVLWMTGVPIFKLVFWWMAFLVLTIAGERLELSRILRPAPRRTHFFSFFTVLILLGAGIATINLDLGTRMNRLGLLALGFWFIPNDIATHNLRHPTPLTRNIAFCLFSGFLWLIIGGGLMLVIGAQYAGPYYDAMLHIVFVGFVMSMIFGHAPIIFPAIVQVPIAFSPTFYIHLALIHLSLLVRVAGDLFAWPVVRMWGGMLNAAAILLFLGTTGYSIWKDAKS